MPDEAPNYRELLDAAGYPPIMGGSPEGDEPGTDQPTPDNPAPEPSDQATKYAGAPAEPDPFPDDLDLSAVPEDPAEARKWIAQRHTQMQGAMTRATQTAAEQRREAAEIVTALRDPEQSAEVLRELGYDIADAGPNPQEPPDPEEQLRAELDQVKGYLSEREQTEQDDRLAHAEDQFIAQRVSEIEAREGREFSDPEKNLIRSYGIANRFQDGEPDLDSGFKLLAENEQASRERYLESKRAPRKPGAGVTALRQVDPDNEDETLEAMAERYEALSAANQQDAGV